MSYKTGSVYPLTPSIISLIFYSPSHSCSSHTCFPENTKFMFFSGSFYLLFSLPRTFSLGSLITFLISFRSLSECDHLSGPSLATLFKNRRAHTHTCTHILSPFSALFHSIALNCHTYFTPNYHTYFTFLSATPVRTEIFVYCRIPNDENTTWHTEYMFNK